MSRRTDMLASTIQKVLATLIQRELSDPRIVGLPSITRVRVSADLSIADIYLTIMGTPGQQTAALNALRHSASLLRLKLTKQLTLRIAPFLKFHLDDQLKKELEILDALRLVAEENVELDRKRAEKAAAQAAADLPGQTLPSAADPSAPGATSPSKTASHPELTSLSEPPLPTNPQPPAEPATPPPSTL